MQSFYPEQFEREMGCTEAEWLGWLPRAIGAHAYALDGRSLNAEIDAGRLRIDWRVEAPRAMGLMRLPRLRVCFGFSGLDDAARLRFMKRFDLYTQRGGG